ncbi:hypothetical protein TrVE_jg13743 [Triparma verrucosa]|uniref:DOT1 domain-containing protein n=1 Tax=Triparma verrucosa TaxID=1606542 RepID=A0A9W7CCP3_9STRA|nr:hypothetical protein TrVE_jg13743 [Triparma verrucosa]
MSAPQLTLFLLLHFIIFTTPYVIPSIHSINPPCPAYTSTITSLKSLPTKKFDFINNLYPPSDVENRNGISRKDGYWRYVQANREPPLEYTYGEFELGAFMRVVDCALGYLEKKEEDVTLLDLGSGAGRLVTAASLCYSFRMCRGVEILPSLHDYAVEMQSSLGSATDFQRSPTSFVCGSWNDKYLYLGDSDIVFVYSSCLGDEQREELTTSLGSQLQPGAIVITTEYPLTPPSNSKSTQVEYDFETLEVLNDVENELVGGTSTVFIHRITSSGWTSDLESWMNHNRPSPEEVEALKVLNDIEERAGGTDHFLFRVQFENNCKFHNLPARIWSSNNSE